MLVYSGQVDALSQRGPRGRRGGSGLPRLLGCAAWLVVLALLGQAALAESDARVTFGLGGNLVAGAWNPLQVTVRDAPPSTLSLRIDEGDLVMGPRIVRYRAAVPGGRGVTVFDDDVYIPPFQNLTWTLDSADRVLASGSLGARDADGRPLQVVVSADPGAWRAAFDANARFVDVAASQLPGRAAAYDGVASLLVDGTAAAPRSEAVAAAAAGGADVLLIGQLPASQAGLDRLAGSGVSRLGAGQVQRLPAHAGAVKAALASWHPQDRAALVSALVAAPLVHAPRSAPQPLVLSLAAAYALLVVLTLRFGGTPGVVAAVALALVVSLAGWRLLRPPQPVLSASRTLMLGGGGLSLALGVEERLTLPAATVNVGVAARPLSVLPYRTGPDGTHVPVARWHGVALALRPSLSPSVLRFDGERLHNAGPAPLRHVYVVGAGDQGTLEPGASRPVRPGEEVAASPELDRLTALLPTGSALAEAPGAIWVALPPAAGQDGGTR